jgi:hypothetical protein
LGAEVSEIEEKKKKKKKKAGNKQLKDDSYKIVWH